MDLRELCSVLVRVDVVLCVGMDGLRYCEEVQRAGEKVDALRRPLETCLVDKDILMKVFLDKFQSPALLGGPLYHRYIKSWSFHNFVRDAPIATHFRSRLSIVIVTKTQVMTVVARNDVNTSTYP
jgi:hypothetical protein